MSAYFDFFIATPYGKRAAKIFPPLFAKACPYCRPCKLGLANRHPLAKAVEKIIDVFHKGLQLKTSKPAGQSRDTSLHYRVS